MSTTLRIGLYTLVLVSMVVTAWADPRQWNPAGIPIRQGKHIDWTREVARDAQGNTVMVWSDLRSGISAVYAQMINSSGAIQWTSEGVRLGNSSKGQMNPAAVAVDGGWVVAWIDFRNDSCGDVWAQKISFAGDLLWNTAGVPVDEFPATYVNQMSVRVVSDGSAGAYVAWEDQRRDMSDIYAQRLLSDGSRAWTSSLAVTNLDGEQIDINLDKDGNGNLLVVWKDSRDPADYNIYTAKVTSDGQIPWGENGLLVCGRTGEQGNPRIGNDGLGGCYIAWFDRSGSTQRDIRIQHLNGSGQFFSANWVQDGLVLCNAPNDQTDICIALSSNQGAPDGCLILWNDQRVNGYVYEVYAQKVSSEGQMQWTTNGLKVWGDAQTEAGHTCSSPRLISDGVGGLICAWSDTRTDEQGDVWASRVLANGAFAWSADGVPVVVADKGQYSPILALVNNGAYVFWHDKRTGSTGLRYQKLDMASGGRLYSVDGIEYVYGLDEDARDPRIISLTQGRVGIVWTDYRLGADGARLYYQVINSEGNIERAVNGDPVSPQNSGPNNAHQKDAVLCSDGNGGFFIAYKDQRMGVVLNRVSHVNSLGQMDVSPEGILVSPTDLDQDSPYLCQDGTGGFYVSWSGYNSNFTVDVYAMRMSGRCEPMWTQPAHILGSVDYDCVLQGMVSSSEGCCMLTWRSGTFGHYDINAARIYPDGTITWSMAVCDAENAQDQSTLISDGQGGAYFAWADSRNTNLNKDIYAQHLTAAGVESWTHNGIAVVSQTLNQARPKLKLDSQGNLLVGWEDYRNNTDFNLFMQKITPAGVLRWEESGRPLCTAAGDQQTFTSVMDHADGLVGAWRDSRLPYDRIFATHIDSTGQPVNDPYWVPASGGLVGGSEWTCFDPAIAEDRVGGYIIAWEHGETMDYEYPFVDLWAQRIYDGFGVQNAHVRNGSLPANYALGQNYPNPFNPGTEITFDLPHAGHVVMKAFDVLGREVATIIDGKMTGGSYTVNFDASKLPSGVYIYQLQSGNYSASRKMIVLK
jgi:hypothetical protein